jgi:NADPH2:quinone reductase
MRALYLVRHGDAHGAFEMREGPTPEAGPGQLCIAVEAFGLNYADVSARHGTYQDAPPLPSVLGYEVVGRVEAIGRDASGFTAGQRVAALTRFGGYATAAVTDCRAAVPIPDDMDAGIAAALPTQGCTAYFCAEEMVRLYPGDHVLVQAAAGGVGTLLVQLAKHRGCYVYGTAGSDKKLEYLRSQGVDMPINYNRDDFAEVIRRTRGSEGLDVIFDSIGGSAIRKGIQLLAPGGRIVCFGAASHEAGSFQILRSLKFALSFGFPHPIPLLINSRSILGVNMLRIADHRPLVLQRCMQNVAKLAFDGVLRPVVGGRFTADRIGEAHSFLEGRGSTGKIVVTWS